MECTYRMRTDTVYDEEGKKYTVFGIESVDLHGTTLQSVPDVFFDRQKAKQFVDLCNSEELSPIHLMDVIEDVLAV